MIRHILLFKFNEGIEESLKEETVSRLHQLGDLCPTIGKWTIGVNLADSPSAYDVAEIGDFSSIDDLNAYKAHEAHRNFSEFVRPIATWALSDIEIDS
jgi:hypothetical protein